MRGFVLHTRNRQRDAESCSFTLFAFNANVSAMFLDNCVGDTQSQPRSFPNRLCREESIEDSGQIFVCDATAIIGNFNIDIRLIRMSLDSDDAMLPNRLACIDKQIHVNLIQLTWHTGDLRNIAVVFLYRRFVFNLIPDELQRLLNAFVDIYKLEFGFVNVGEVFQVLDNLPDAVNPGFGLRNDVGEIAHDKIDVEFIFQPIDTIHKVFNRRRFKPFE